jgi:hypothetical protein
LLLIFILSFQSLQKCIYFGEGLAIPECEWKNFVKLGKDFVELCTQKKFVFESSDFYLHLAKSYVKAAIETLWPENAQAVIGGQTHPM